MKEVHMSSSVSNSNFSPIHVNPEEAEKINKARAEWNKAHADNPIIVDQREKTRWQWKRVFLVNENGKIEFKELNMIQRLIRILLGPNYAPKSISDTIFPPERKLKIAEVFHQTIVNTELNNLNPTRAPGPVQPDSPQSSMPLPIPPSSNSVQDVDVETPGGPTELNNNQAALDKAISDVMKYQERLAVLVYPMEVDTYSNVIKLEEYKEEVNILIEEQVGELLLNKPSEKQRREILEIRDTLNHLKQVIDQKEAENKNWVDYLKGIARNSPKNSVSEEEAYLMVVTAPKGDSPRLTMPPVLPNPGNYCYMNSTLQGLLTALPDLEKLVHTPIDIKLNESPEDFHIRKEIQLALLRLLNVVNSNGSVKEILSAMLNLRIKVGAVQADVGAQLEGQHDATAMLGPILYAMDITMKFREVYLTANLNKIGDPKEASLDILNLDMVDNEFQSLVEKRLQREKVEDHADYKFKRLEFVTIPEILPIRVQRQYQVSLSEYESIIAPHIMVEKALPDGIYAEILRDFRGASEDIESRAELELEERVASSLGFAKTPVLRAILKSKQPSLLSKEQQIEKWLIEMREGNCTLSEEEMRKRLESFYNDPKQTRMEFNSVNIQRLRQDPLTLPAGDIIQVPINGQQVPYHLVCTVNHKGGASGGHYTAYVNRDGKFYHCDDKRRIEGLATRQEAKMEEGYIYFFKKV